jgi:hypothetical protein
MSSEGTIPAYMSAACGYGEHQRCPREYGTWACSCACHAAQPILGSDGSQFCKGCGRTRLDIADNGHADDCMEVAPSVPRASAHSGGTEKSNAVVGERAPVATSALQLAARAAALESLLQRAWLVAGTEDCDWNEVEAIARDAAALGVKLT